MTTPDIPSDVRALLQRALPSMVHVESLLQLAKAPSAAMQPQDIAARTGSSVDVVASALADLTAARLAEPVPGSTPAAWQLAATDVATANAVATLRELYDRRPVTLVKAVYDRPPDPARAFADAFRVRAKGER